MSNENFNVPELLQNKFKSPFPTLKNLYADRLQEITDFHQI
jgi:hypothetical protein